MAKKYSDSDPSIKDSFFLKCLFDIDESDENIDHLKEKYDEFMPFVIAFGIVTVFSCVQLLCPVQYLDSCGAVGRFPDGVEISEKRKEIEPSPKESRQ